MELTFRIKRVCFLSLSQACLILGILDLIINSYVFTKILITAPRTEDIGCSPILLLIISSIGAFSSFSMIVGSSSEYHWAMLPHLGWHMVLFVTFVVMGFFSLENFAKDYNLSIHIYILHLCHNIVVLSSVAVFLFLYWSIMYNRHREIKENRLPRSNQIQIE